MREGWFYMLRERVSDNPKRKKVIGSIVFIVFMIISLYFIKVSYNVSQTKLVLMNYNQQIIE